MAMVLLGAIWRVGDASISTLSEHTPAKRLIISLSASTFGLKPVSSFVRARVPLRTSQKLRIQITTQVQSACEMVLHTMSV